jgi:S1-C subfamily serine protease
VGGTLVTHVFAHGPADEAGLQPGDLLLSIGGQHLDEDAALGSFLIARPAGTAGRAGRVGVIEIGAHTPQRVTALLQVEDVIVKADGKPAATAEQAAAALGELPLSGWNRLKLVPWRDPLALF